MVLAICTVSGCPNVAPCNEHPPPGWTPDRVRGSRHERGYGNDWQRARRQALKAQPLCTCGAQATDVDHVTPLAEGGDHRPSNLRPLCRRCHQAKTADDAARGRARARRNQ